jgi:hypothetical protein
VAFVDDEDPVEQLAAQGPDHAFADCIRLRRLRWTGAVLTDAGIDVVPNGVRMPRMNSIMERWGQSRRRELLDRTLI